MKPSDGKWNNAGHEQSPRALLKSLPWRWRRRYWRRIASRPCWDSSQFLPGHFVAGCGRDGTVYRARDTRLGREVAIKVLPSAFATDADRLRRFEREARAAGQLNHPNILAIYDVGTHQGSPYIVCERLEGETLRDRLKGTALPQGKAVEVAVQIARGLAAAHEKGIVHRDLKPENLFLTSDGRLKILDFGLAKLTRPQSDISQTDSTQSLAGTLPGQVLGTIGYMAPEQVRGEAVDHRADLLNWGPFSTRCFRASGPSGASPTWRRCMPS